MKKYEITEEQIKDLANGKAKSKLKQLFPEVFEKKLEVGKWYKCKGQENFLIFITSECNRYGFDTDGKWFNVFKINSKINLDSFNNAYYEATPEEVETALINKAKKMGYKPDNFTCLFGSSLHVLDVEEQFFFNDNELWQGIRGRANCVFKDGKWAEVVKQTELTMQEIADKFNIPVETLKIKK